MFDGKSKCVVNLYMIAVRLANILICFCSALPSPTCNQDLCCHTRVLLSLQLRSSFSQEISPALPSTTLPEQALRAGSRNKDVIHPVTNQFTIKRISRLLFLW